MAQKQSEVSPDEVLTEVVAAIPLELHKHIVVIGSLAAAHAFSRAGTPFMVRTKDVDSVVTPRTSADETGKSVADKLIAAGWKPKTEGEFATPGGSATPDSDLPALRLFPPESHEWFLELLTEPEPGQVALGWMRIVLSSGDHYGLPSFRFTGIATHGAEMTKYGVRIARPEMMALANLLEHPAIGPQLIKDTTTKRSNKDLGRSIALALLSGDDAVLQWADIWLAALKAQFPTEWQDLAAHAADGLRALLNDPENLKQALDSANNGVLASKPSDAGTFAAIGRRLLAEAERLR